MTLYFVEDSMSKNFVKNKYKVYKKAFIKSDQYDVKILLSLFRYYKYFLITPWNLDEETNWSIGKYVTIILVLVTLMYFSSTIYISYILMRHSAITRLILTIIWIIMNMFFMSICFLNANIFKQDNWRIASTSLEKSEYILRKLKFSAPPKNNLLVLQLTIIYLPFALLTTCRLYLLFKYESLIFAYTYTGTSIAYFYVCHFLLFIMRLNGVLQSRYNFIEDDLKRITSDNTKDQDKVNRLTEIVHLYKTFTVFIDNINHIFGPHLFLLVSVSVTYMLCAISYNMNFNARNEGDKIMSVLTIITTVIVIVSLIVLIMSCDALEKSGLRVVKTCYVLHESAESRLIKDNLLQMAQYAEQWRPVISAAGFYNVNQSTLSAIFEAIITYLVIIIQFNLALAQ